MAIVNLPEEVMINEILLKLPVKSLFSCSLVCKLWRFLIRNPTFIETHRKFIQSKEGKDQGHLLLVQGWALPYTIDETRFSLHWDNSSLDEHTNLVSPFYKNYRVAGICNGLVCLVDRDFIEGNDTILIWNPCIRKYVILPRAPIMASTNARRIMISYGFGYDSSTNDYKVLRDNQIWSLARGCWQTLKGQSPGQSPEFSTGVLVNDALHWVINDQGICFRTVCFDMITESFSEIGIPKDQDLNFTIVSNYKESLAGFHIYGDGMTLVHDMWVMKDYGVVESWTKICTISLHDDGILWRPPLGYRKNTGQVVLKLTDGKSRLVDPDRAQDYIYLQMDKYCDICCMQPFAESLVLLDKACATSY